MYKHILVASDLTEFALPALRTATANARLWNAKLTVLHVVEPLREARPWITTLAPPDIDTFERLLQQEAGACKSLLMKQLESLAASGALPAHEVVVSHGPTADTVIAEAQSRQADLIVVGTHGRRGIKHMLLGSVAERIVRTSPCAVLVAR